MERLIEYYGGVAVIKDKARLPEAMAKLAAYEDAYKLELENIRRYQKSCLDGYLIAGMEKCKNLQTRQIPA